ncbi:MAG TPA: hypothetical protein VK636_01655 [Gemmatimonadaceae bacterium]|nr:hypothetical protein [Gemmatimonadaceae bacterium]
MNPPMPMPMLDQSVTTSLSRPEMSASPFEWGHAQPPDDTKESLASLVRRYRPEIEALLREPPDSAAM